MRTEFTNHGRRWAPGLVALMAVLLCLVLLMQAGTAHAQSITYAGSSNCGTVPLPNPTAYVKIKAIGAAGEGTWGYQSPTTSGTQYTSTNIGFYAGQGGKGDEVEAELTGKLGGHHLRVCVDTGGESGGGGASGVSLGTSFAQPLVVGAGGGAGGAVGSGGSPYQQCITSNNFLFGTSTDCNTFTLPTLNLTSSSVQGGAANEPGTFAPGVSSNGMTAPDVGGSPGTSHGAGQGGEGESIPNPCDQNGQNFCNSDPGAAGCAGATFAAAGLGAGGAPNDIADDEDVTTGNCISKPLSWTPDDLCGCSGTNLSGEDLGGGGAGLYGGGAGGTFGLSENPGFDGYQDVAGGGGGYSFCGSKFLASDSGIGVTDCKTIADAGTRHNPTNSAGAPSVTVEIASDPTIKLDGPRSGQVYAFWTNTGSGGTTDQPSGFPATAAYTCSEPVSGIHSCSAVIRNGSSSTAHVVAHVDNGAAIPVIPAGTYYFDVTAESNAKIDGKHLTVTDDRKFTYEDLTQNTNPIKPVQK